MPDTRTYRTRVTYPSRSNVGWSDRLQAQQQEAAQKAAEAEHERRVREAQRVVAAERKAAERAAEERQREQQKIRNAQIETEARKTGRAIYKDEFGNWTPKQSDEEFARSRQVEQVNAERKALYASQPGRKAIKDPSTGELKPEYSDEQWKKRTEAKAAIDEAERAARLAESARMEAEGRSRIAKGYQTAELAKAKRDAADAEKRFKDADKSVDVTPDERERLRAEWKRLRDINDSAEREASEKAVTAPMEAEESFNLQRQNKQTADDVARLREDLKANRSPDWHPGAAPKAQQPMPTPVVTPPPIDPETLPANEVTDLANRSTEEFNAEASKLAEDQSRIQQHFNATNQKLEALRQQNAQALASGAKDLVNVVGKDDAGNDQPEQWSNALWQQYRKLHSEREELNRKTGPAQEELNQRQQALQARGAEVQLVREVAERKRLEERNSAVDTLRQRPGFSALADTVRSLDEEYDRVSSQLNPNASEEDKVALQAIQDRYVQEREVAIRDGQENHQKVIQALNAERRKIIEASRAEAQSLLSGADYGSMSGDDSGKQLGEELSQESFRRQVEAGVKLGLPPEEAAAIVQDLALMEDGWDGVPGVKPADQARILSTGDVVVNPALFIEPEKFKQAVESTDATPEAKAQALEKLPALEEAALTALLKNIAGAPGFHEFALKNGAQFMDPNTVDLSRWTPEDIEAARAKSKFKTPAELVKAYREGPGKNWFRNQAHQAIIGAAGSVVGWAQQGTGLYGAITGNEDAINASLNFGKTAQQLAGQSAAMQSGQWTNKLSSGATNLLPAMLGGAVMPQALAMYGTAGVAAGQSFSGTFADAVQAGVDQGMDLQSARKSALLPAIASGLTTAALTYGFGPSGVESMFAKDEFKLAGKAFLKNLAVQSGLEFTEEAADQAMNGIIASLSYDPKKSFTDIVNEALEAGALGALLGGGVTAVTNADRPVAVNAVGDVEGDSMQGRPFAGALPADLVDPPRVNGFQQTADLAASDAELDAFDAGDPMVTSQTVMQAQTLRDIAQGVPLETLTDEQLAIVGVQRDDKGQIKNAKTKDGIPLVKVENGQPIITQGALNMLEQRFPRTRSLISLSEQEARQRISQQQTESPAPTDANVSGAEATGEPRGMTTQAVAVPADSGMEFAEGAASATPAGVAPAISSEPILSEKSTLISDKIPTESQSWSVGKTSTGGVVFKPDESTESQLEQPAVQQLDELAAQTIADTETRLGRVAAGKLAVKARLLSDTVKKAAPGFANVRFEAIPDTSGPAYAGFDGSLVLDVARTLDTIQGKSVRETRAWLESVIDEEFKHRVAMDLDQNSPEWSKDLTDLYDSLPDSIKELSRATYFGNVDTPEQKRNFPDSFNARHEFFRQYWSNAKVQKLTESALTQKGMLAKLRSLIAKFVKELRRIQKGANPQVKAIADRLIAQAEARAAELKGEETVDKTAVKDSLTAQAKSGSTRSLDNTASWVVRNKETGEALFETFDKKKVDALNTKKYEAVPIQEYLGSINGQQEPWLKSKDTTSPSQKGPVSQQPEVSPTQEQSQAVGEIQRPVRESVGNSERRGVSGEKSELSNGEMNALPRVQRMREEMAKAFKWEDAQTGWDQARMLERALQTRNITYVLGWNNGLNVAMMRMFLREAGISPVKGWTQKGVKAALEEWSNKGSTESTNDLIGRFIITTARTVRRGDLEGGAPQQEYVPDLQYGHYSTAKEAKAAFMRQYDPALKNADDDFAAMHFDRHSRNLGHFKVRRMTKEDGAALPASAPRSEGGEKGLATPSFSLPSSSPILAQDPSGLTLTPKGLYTPPIRAYHGTPHKVDRFTTEKIGTGEGAQAYGWGLYFAENPVVAESYRALARGDEGAFRLPAGDVQGIATVLHLRGEELARRVYAHLGDRLDGAIAAARKAIGENSRLYSVSLNVEEDRLVDWDSPLSKQSNFIQEALPKVGLKPNGRKYSWLPGVTMGQAYRQIAADFQDNLQGAVSDGEKAASEAMASEGIQGIKFWDGGSRDKGEGTRNFVIFRDEDIRITHENGSPVDPYSLAQKSPSPGGSTTKSVPLPDQGLKKVVQPFHIVKTVEQMEKERGPSAPPTDPSDTEVVSSLQAQEAELDDELTEEERDALAYYHQFAKPPPKSEQPKTEPAAEPEVPQTSLKNAVVDEERAARGLPPRLRPVAQAWGEAGIAAGEMLLANPDSGRNLVKELTDNPRPLRTHEHALLLMHKVETRAKLERAAQKVNETADDSEENKIAKRDYDLAQLEEIAIDAVGYAVGTESGRSLNIRKMMMRTDTSLQGLLQAYRVQVNLGKPLTDEQRRLVTFHADKLADAQRKIDALEEEASKKEAEKGLQRLTADLSKPRGKATGVRKFIGDKAAEARARVKALLSPAPLSTAPTGGSGVPPIPPGSADLITHESPYPGTTKERIAAYAWPRFYAAWTSNLPDPDAPLTPSQRKQLDAEWRQNLKDENAMEIAADNLFTESRMDGFDWRVYDPAPSQTEQETEQGGGLYTPPTSSDAEYLAAVERGDMETARKIVLEAAKPYRKFAFQLKLKAKDVLEKQWKEDDGWWGLLKDGWEVDGSTGFREDTKKTLLERALEARQVVDASPVLRDSTGRIIPPSERFNPGNKSALHTPPSPNSIIDDLATVGAAYIADGVDTTEAFTKLLVSEFGPTVEQYATEAFKAAKKAYASAAAEFEASQKPAGILKAAKDKLKPEQGADLSARLLTDLATAYIREGINDAEELVTRITKDIQGIYPGATEEQVRIVYSGYGKTTKPTKDELKRTLTETRSQLRLIQAVTDANAGKAPLKSGFQRGKPSDRVRELNQQLKSAMKRMGIETTGEEQLASAKKAVINRLKNQIADLDSIIKGKRKPGDEKSVVEYDAEMTALLQERNELKAHVDDLTGPSPELKWNRKAQQAAAASAEYYKRRIAAKDFESKRSAGQPESEATKKARDEAKAAKEEFERLREATGIPAAEALERARTKLEDEIAKAQQRLITGERPAPGQKKLPPAELESLRQTLSNLRKSIRLVEGGGRRTEAQRAEQAEKSVQKQIEELNRRIAAKDTAARAKPLPVEETEALKALRQERDFLREIYALVREAKNPRRLPEEIALDNFRKRVEKLRREAELGLSRKEYLEVTKPDPLFQSRMDKATFELERAKEGWYNELLDHKLKARNPIEKILGTAVELMNFRKAIITSVDLSAMLIQGGFSSIGHPVLAAKGLKSMLKAAWSAENQHAIMQEIRRRPNFPLYKQSKLFLSEMDGASLNKAEEAFMSRWIEKVHGIKGALVGGVVGAATGFVSGGGIGAIPGAALGATFGAIGGFQAAQRAYVTFLNKLRADLFDVVSSTMFRDGRIEKDEATGLSNFINESTGRGKIPFLTENQQTNPALTALLWAPKLAASRFNLLLGTPIFGKSGRKAGPRVQAAIAKEYARFLAGAGTILALFSLLKDDDDDAPYLETDPRSTDFMKARFGNTRVNFFGGLQSAAVLLARLGMGQIKRKDKILDTRGPNKDRFAPSSTDLIGQFFRFKLSPQAGDAATLLDAEDAVGNPITPAQMAVKAFVPISVPEIAEVLRAQGVPKGSAIALAAVFGANLGTYDSGTPFSTDPKILDEMVRNWNAQNPDAKWSPSASNEYDIKILDPDTGKIREEKPMTPEQKIVADGLRLKLREDALKKLAPQNIQKPDASTIKAVKAARTDSNDKVQQVMRRTDWQRSALQQAGYDKGPPADAPAWAKRLWKAQQSAGKPVAN